MSKWIVLLIIFCLFCSCRDHQQLVHIPCYTILSEIDQSKLSDFVDSVEYIPLETCEDAFIGSVSRVIKTQGRIVVGDAVSNCVLVFDEKGKFLNKIDRQGRGPEEYLRLYDFDVPERDTLLYFYIGGSIKIYDFQGEYKETIKIADPGLSPVGMAIAKDEIFLSMNYNTYTGKSLPYNMVFLNGNGDLIDCQIPYSKRIAGRLNYSPRPHFRYNKDTLSYFSNFRDTLYERVDHCTKARFAIDFAKYKIPEITTWNLDQFMKMRFEDYAMLYQVARVGNIYYLLFMINRNRYLTILNPVTQAFKTIDMTKGLVYDISKAEHFFDFVSVQERALVTYYEWGDVPDLFAKLGVPDDNNPIVVIYYMKDGGGI